MKATARWLFYCRGMVPVDNRCPGLAETGFSAPACGCAVLSQFLVGCSAAFEKIFSFRARPQGCGYAVQRSSGAME